MAHDGFLGGAFHELPWPLAAGAPFVALQVQAPQHTLASAGWDHDAAMSSLVPSHEAVLMEQLASRLGVGAPSPPSSRYASCYGTPVGSPSGKPVNDAPFAERAARLSCLAGGKLSRVASSQSLLAEQTPSPRGGVALHASDGSSSDGPSRKRKAPAAEKAKPTAKSPDAERRAKKSKLSADVGAEDDEPKPAADGNGGNGKELVAETLKDYIHVRARRGQATDSHSLAERVRREKISERMKLLQDIVPGCSKVTGKAVMLDEIINYVQSLQRQVEFLSMKLSTVNPRLEVDVDSFVQKDPNQSACVPAPTSLPHPPAPVYSMEGCNTAFCYASSPAPAPAVQSPVAATTGKSFEPPSSFVTHGLQDGSLEGFQNSNPQVSSPWEDDLQSLVQMGFRGNA